ncbi:Basic-leucine zipper transcription factor family protein [Heracleum sosnowskyi]|uniref:Basic-leucine zipper transcription factor family protein n=1 Tax=Heracleum sosnowskyi TaxID=360622 RepID=A0AAD8MC96_9APIA|nr:Basic-leucine zipper transcription factor family protein [Heracleum sosnowskyi]
MVMSTEPAQLQFSPDEINDLLSLINYYPTTTSTTTTLSSDTNRPVYSLEERKHRRMISNRESARRSRLRKKRHLEKLVTEMNRLKCENRELKERLCLATYQSHVVMVETDLLRSEYFNLKTRLLNLYPSLMSMQL